MYLLAALSLYGKSEARASTRIGPSDPRDGIESMFGVVSLIQLQGGA